MNTFNRDEFYEKAHSGEILDKEPVLNFIKGFDGIIVWGAGNLGSAVGKYLLKENVNIVEYWDKNSKNIGECLGIKVNEPFHKSYASQNILVIPCIVNGSLGDEWTSARLNDNGYTNILKGMEVYEGLICPLSDATEFDIETCTRQKACSLCNCKRYVNILSKNFEKKEDTITLQLVTFIISNKCSLKCKHCGQFITHYPAEERKNYTLSNILRDIDNFMQAVDFVGMISIIGGEPFLHADLDKVVLELLKYQNLGVINITTNGVCNIETSLLEKIKNPRVKISFSIYKTYLSDSQKALIDKNINKVKESGINYSLSEPVWTIPAPIENSPIRDKGAASLRKTTCKNRIMAASVRDGAFIPCSTIEVGTGLRIFSDEDCVDVTNPENLHKRLRAALERESYMACLLCRDAGTETIIAGEQS